MGKVKMTKSAIKRVKKGKEALKKAKKNKMYPPTPYAAKGPALKGGKKTVDLKPKTAPKPKKKPASKKKPVSKTTRTEKALGWMGSAAKGVKDISNAIGVGGRAFTRSIKNKPVGKLPTKVATHVGSRKGRYGTGAVITSGVVSNRAGTSKGRRQASKDLKI